MDKHHSLLMSKRIAGPYGADARDHVISYRAKRDIGEGARERERNMNVWLSKNVASAERNGKIDE